MKYIIIYLKRLFTKDLKKQMFLIIGIAAFMTALSRSIMSNDSWEQWWAGYIEEVQWGFSHKILDASDQLVDLVKDHEGIERVNVIEKIALQGGMNNVDWVVSSAVPEEWQLKLLYGELPKAGEVLLTEHADVGNRQPVPGEVITVCVKVGEEIKNISVKVSGVVEGMSGFIDSYAFLYEEDFRALVCDIPAGMMEKDVFMQVKSTEDDEISSVLLDLYEKMGSYQVQRWGMADVEPEYDWKSIFGGILKTVLLCGACLGAIIYIVLKDQKKTIGILRALGAKKTQIATMLSTYILIFGGIGVLVGSGLVLLFREVERKVLIADTAVGEYAGWVSVVLIPAIGLIILLVVQIPGISVLLKATPSEQMNDMVYIGDNLISFKNCKIFKVKHPIWWYAGLEGKRLRGRSVALALITVLSMVLPIFGIFYLNVEFMENAREAIRETYTIEKRDGYFTEREINQILAIQGISSAGFGVEQKGTEVAEYKGQPIFARLQILDEVSFEQMKIRSEQKGKNVPATTGNELLEEGGILIRQTFNTIKEKISCGEEVTLLSPTGERFPHEIVYVAENEGEVDVDYCIFVSYKTYCEVFGEPKLQRLTVLLNDTVQEDIEKQLGQVGNGILVSQDELLLGNTEKELNSDKIVTRVTLCVTEILSAVAFLFCYNSFYYLAKMDEYKKLYAMGASKRMIRQSVLYQSIRVAGVLSVLAVTLGYAMYRWSINMCGDEWIQENASKFPTVSILLSLVVVMVVYMGAAWFASKQVQKELERIA